MKLTDGDYEEILTIICQCKAMMPSLRYNENLEKEVFYCAKNKTQPKREAIQQIHNNYLALTLIGLNYCNTKTYKKLDYYMDNEY